MLNKLIKLAKQEGMFDLAFILADKHNLYNELFNALKGNYNISYNLLKKEIDLRCIMGYPSYLNINYNLFT